MTNFTTPTFFPADFNSKNKAKIDKINSLSDKELKLLIIMLGLKTRDAQAIVDILDLDLDVFLKSDDPIKEYFFSISHILPELYEVYKKRINLVNNYQGIQPIVNKTRENIINYYYHYNNR